MKNTYKITIIRYAKNLTIPKSNRKIVETVAQWIPWIPPNMQIHDYSLFWLGTSHSIKSDGVKLVVWV
jgi:hypothetical protein